MYILWYHNNIRRGVPHAHCLPSIGSNPNEWYINKSERCRSRPRKLGGPLYTLLTYVRTYLVRWTREGNTSREVSSACCHPRDPNHRKVSLQTRLIKKRAKTQRYCSLNHATSCVSLDLPWRRRGGGNTVSQHFKWFVSRPPPDTTYSHTCMGQGRAAPAIYSAIEAKYILQFASWYCASTSTSVETLHGAWSLSFPIFVCNVKHLYIIVFCIMCNV